MADALRRNLHSICAWVSLSARAAIEVWVVMILAHLFLSYFFGFEMAADMFAGAKRLFIDCAVWLAEYGRTA